MAIHPSPLELRLFHVHRLGSDREPELFSFTLLKLRWVERQMVVWGPLMGDPTTLQFPPDPVCPLVRSPPTPYCDFLPLSTPQAPRGKALPV